MIFMWWFVYGAVDSYHCVPTIEMAELRSTTIIVYCIPGLRYSKWIPKFEGFLKWSLRISEVKSPCKIFCHYCWIAYINSKSKICGSLSMPGIEKSPTKRRFVSVTTQSKDLTLKNMLKRQATRGFKGKSLDRASVLYRVNIPRS